MSQVLGKSGVSTGCVSDRRRWEELGRWKVGYERRCETGGASVGEQLPPEMEASHSQDW